MQFSLKLYYKSIKQRQVYSYKKIPMPLLNTGITFAILNALGKMSFSIEEFKNIAQKSNNCRIEDFTILALKPS